MNYFIHTPNHLPQTGEPGSERASCEEYDIEEEQSSDQPMKRDWSWGSHGGLQPTNFVESTSPRLAIHTDCWLELLRRAIHIPAKFWSIREVVRMIATFSDAALVVPTGYGHVLQINEQIETSTIVCRLHSSPDVHL